MKEKSRKSKGMPKNMPIFMLFYIILMVILLYGKNEEYVYEYIKVSLPWSGNY